ncbi:hypothetical protein FUAX_53860 (plasmid) [Fulvitalea axinellae]|uniref:Uncharacterized protein n=1 Tax=Fulvitalea axinellae TaxID=1182444 RepID=A0AAU9D2Z3_9BACT|nr:hypothetical protein FUAX_53860 [Fulvitalea axinellae]
MRVLFLLFGFFLIARAGTAQVVFDDSLPERLERLEKRVKELERDKEMLEKEAALVKGQYEAAIKKEEAIIKTAYAERDNLKSSIDWFLNFLSIIAVAVGAIITWLSISTVKDLRTKAESVFRRKENELFNDLKIRSENQINQLRDMIQTYSHDLSLKEQYPITLEEGENNSIRALLERYNFRVDLEGKSDLILINNSEAKLSENDLRNMVGAQRNKHYMYLGKNTTWPFFTDKSIVSNCANSNSTIYNNLMDLIRYVDATKELNREPEVIS